MAEGQKWSAQDPATTFVSGDIMSIVQGGDNKKLDFDVLSDIIIDLITDSVGDLTGTIIEWGGDSDLSDIPTGYLPCDGSAISRTTYSDLNTLMSAASYPWGNGDGSTTFNLPKGGAVIDWSSTSTWTAGASITLNHGMGVAFDEYVGQIFVRADASPDKIYNVTNLELYNTTPYGQRLNGIDGDLNNCYIQINTQQGVYISDSGGQIVIPTSGWSYKVVLTQKAMSARSIIKV